MAEIFVFYGSHVSNLFRGSLLETLILRDCVSLEEVNELRIIFLMLSMSRIKVSQCFYPLNQRKVCEFLDLLLMSRTNFRSIRHIVSSQ